MIIKPHKNQSNINNKPMYIYFKKLNAVLDEFKEEFVNCKENDRGFGYFLRHMYIQAGKKEKTDYFSHKQRRVCEQNVLNTFR